MASHESLELESSNLIGSLRWVRGNRLTFPSLVDLNLNQKLSSRTKASTTNNTLLIQAKISVIKTSYRFWISDELGTSKEQIMVQICDLRLPPSYRVNGVQDAQFECDFFKKISNIP